MDHEMRASDAERDELVAGLREHATAGRLTTDEPETRTSAALAEPARGAPDRPPGAGRAAP